MPQQHFPRESLFSSRSEEWETPPAFFDFVDREFRFELDAAATDLNAKCDRYLTKREDGLVVPWNSDRIWLNPPYGRGIVSPWLERAAHHGLQGATVVCLVHARTDTEEAQAPANETKLAGVAHQSRAINTTTSKPAFQRRTTLRW